MVGRLGKIYLLAGVLAFVLPALCLVCSKTPNGLLLDHGVDLTDGVSNVAAIAVLPQDKSTRRRNDRPEETSAPYSPPGKERTALATMRREQKLAWGLLVLALLASAASSLFGLYKTFWWFDEALHGYFSFAATLVLALYAYGALLTGRRRHEVLLVLTVAGLGLALGTLWEMTEWAYDQLVGVNAILGKKDTMIDLTLDAVGGLAGGLLSLRIFGK